MELNNLTPELSVSDFDKSIFFYINILGFKIDFQREENYFASISLNNTQLMIEKNNENWNTGVLEYPYGRGVNFFIVVDDISILINRLKTYNYPIFVLPKESWYRVNDMFAGYREFLVLDPDGYLLRFSKHLGYKEAID
jgi:catechol 2,3-dioxygenase-like lactoylglutathione lyase family enzyme